MVAAVENRKGMTSQSVVLVVVAAAAARTFDLLAAEGDTALEACSAVVAWAAVAWTVVARAVVA